MSHDHVGVPRFIEGGFSNNGRVYCYNLITDKIYPTNVERLGTENNYYEPDVEKELLAQSVEHPFSIFYNKFCSTCDPILMYKILDSNKQLVKKFISFMCLRSKQTLSRINETSYSSALFGNMSHSELLRINNLLNVDFLRMIDSGYSYHPLINFSKTHLINNSIGYGITEKDGKVTSFYVPLNIRVGIVIMGNNWTQEKSVKVIGPDNDEIAKHLNRIICRIETELGNGFIFSDDRKLLEHNAEYIRTGEIV